MRGDTMLYGLFMTDKDTTAFAIRKPQTLVINPVNYLAKHTDKIGTIDTTFINGAAVYRFKFKEDEEKDYELRPINPFAMEIDVPYYDSRFEL
jgi:hypothetical protein